jgi:hypothetical protein
VDPFGPQLARADFFGSSITTQSTMTNSSSSSFQNSYPDVGASPSVDRSIGGQQIMNTGHSFYDNYSVPGSIQSLSTFMPATAGTHDLELYHNRAVNQELNQSYFSENISQSPSSIDPGPLLVNGDTIALSHQSAPIG